VCLKVSHITLPKAAAKQPPLTAARTFPGVPRQLLQQHFIFVWSTGLDAGSVILCGDGMKLAEGRF
jgi:hypothetical protein